MKEITKEFIRDIEDTSYRLSFEAECLKLGCEVEIENVEHFLKDVIYATRNIAQLLDELKEATINIKIAERG